LSSTSSEKLREAGQAFKAMAAHPERLKTELPYLITKVLDFEKSRNRERMLEKISSVMNIGPENCSGLLHNVIIERAFECLPILHKNGWRQKNLSPTDYLVLASALGKGNWCHVDLFAPDILTRNNCEFLEEFTHSFFRYGRTSGVEHTAFDSMYFYSLKRCLDLPEASIMAPLMSKSLVSCTVNFHAWNKFTETTKVDGLLKDLIQMGWISKSEVNKSLQKSNIELPFGEKLRDLVRKTVIEVERECLQASTPSMTKSSSRMRL
jgi:hypothetical protein